MASLSVFLNVTDLSKALDFWKALGADVKAFHRDAKGEPYWADLDLDGAEVGLGHIGANKEKEFRKWVSTPLGAGVVVYVTVDRIGTYEKRAEKAGLTFESMLEERPYGKVFTLNDPDGYTITFLEEPELPEAWQKPQKTTKKAPAAKAPRKRT